MSKKNKPWTGNWVEVDGLSESGGQGKVVLVERVEAQGKGERFVLKELIRHNDEDRRGRMHREVAAYEILEHAGVPRCVDSNASRFKDLDMRLFLVTEYIPGPTLEKYANGKPIDAETAIGCMLKLLEVIEYCHSQGVVHRDIKPDNIILRDGDPLMPVLIDFGLSFNGDEESGSLTGTGQELGNRFLHLPELQHAGTGQRDGRADLTQCCGILFYLVTGETPRTLRDKDGQKPHLRENAIRILNRLETVQRDRLFAVFEQGFMHEIDQRFQTAQELRLCLTGTATKSSSEEEARKIERIKAAIGLNEIHQRDKRYICLLEKTGRIIEEVCLEVAEELFGDEWCSPTDYHLDAGNLRLNTMRGLFHRRQPDKTFKPRFIATITHTQLTLHAQEETGRSTPVFICPLGGATDWLKCRNQLRAFYINRAHEIFTGRSLTPLTQPLPEPGGAPLGRSGLSPQLRQLPLRAIVAFAARCARRVEAVLEAKDGHVDKDFLDVLGEAITSAEGYTRGDATSASGASARKAMIAASVATIEDEAMLPGFRHIVAAGAAYNAASAAVFARQDDGDGTVACALNAYDYANSAHSACHLFATLDLRCLLTSALGQYPHLGLPVEPGEGGPLGPLWPGMKPSTKSEPNRHSPKQGDGGA
ncbi:MAG: serine/threonine protein kinase [Isosphaeraceae bacterium]